MNKQLKPRRCAVCKEQYIPKRIGLKITKVCLNAGCVLDWAQGIKAKEFDKETRRRRSEMNDKDKSWWAKKAEKKCNEYIRLRDADKPCISCGNKSAHIKYDAGHFIPVGRREALRYEETNIHKQCSNNCNIHLSGNYSQYRKAIIELYGQEHLDWLEGPHDIPRRRIEDYKEIYEYYRLKVKELKKVKTLAITV